MSSLKNHILISMPHLQDPYFGQSVVYICEHTNEGAMGLVTNHPFPKGDLGKIFSSMSTGGKNLLDLVPSVYLGGPVMIDRGIVLHRPENQVEGTVVISDQFAITSHRGILDKMSKLKDTTDYKLMLGHAGWSAGQLESEIESGDWLLQETDPDLIFKTPSEKMWTFATRSLGFDISSIGISGGDA